MVKAKLENCDSVLTERAYPSFPFIEFEKAIKLMSANHKISGFFYFLLSRQICLVKNSYIQLRVSVFDYSVYKFSNFVCVNRF